MKKTIIIALSLLLCIAVFVSGILYRDHYRTVSGIEMIRVSDGRSIDCWVGKYEVAQRTFEEIMGKNPSCFKGYADNPVETVDGFDAIEFCIRLSVKAGRTPYYSFSIDNSNAVLTNPEADGFRLPTPDEWACAAKAGTTTKYYWGDNEDSSYEWFADNAGRTTHPVGRKKKNPWGFYDICGNVREMCYIRDSETGGYSIVLRGGSWDSNAFWLRTDVILNIPDIKSGSKGFRVVMNK